MKILLTAINAKYIHSNPAVYSLRANAGEMKPHVALAEYTINHREDYVLKEIFKQQPDVLMFSCYIWNVEFVEHLIELFHKVMPTVPIWAGGPEVSYDASDFLMKHPQVKGVMIGEGERTFKELCEYYVNQSSGDAPLERIQGITFRDSRGEIRKTPLRAPLCMDELKFCYEDVKEFENRIIYYESSRGCPFRCSYCLSSIEKQVRFRSLSLVKQELDFFVKHGVKQVKFVDRTFNCNHDHAMEIWKWIQEHDNGKTNFHFEISADLLNQEELELLSELRPGLVQLEIGVQSTCERTIKEVSRHMDLDRVKQAVRFLGRSGNIHLHLDLIAGLPYEGAERFCSSFNEIYRLYPEQLQLGFLKVLKGSKMEQMAEAYGLVFDSHPPYEVLSTNWMTYGEILVLKRVEEMLEVYYNSGQYETSLRWAEKLFKSPFDMFEQLGTYYEQNGYDGMSHSRVRRAEILLEFLEHHISTAHRAPGDGKEQTEVKMEFFRQAVTYDLYLREHMKKHPSFAADQTAYRERIWKLSRQASYPKSAHYEVFSWNFTDLNVQETQKEHCIIVFDYEVRNPLTNQAAVSVHSITEEV